VLVCCERKLLLTGWWLVLFWCEKKNIISWLKKPPAEQSVNFCIGFLRLVPHPIVFLDFFSNPYCRQTRLRRDPWPFFPTRRHITLFCWLRLVLICYERKLLLVGWWVKILLVIKGDR